VPNPCHNGSAIGGLTWQQLAVNNQLNKGMVPPPRKLSSVRDTAAARIMLPAVASAAPMSGIGGWARANRGGELSPFWSPA
jgi:hypothetical protein